MEYQTLAQLKAKEAEARRLQGNALANMTPGRGVVAAMSQLGGMLGGTGMDMLGKYSPEEQKARSLDEILGSRQGPPKTQEEADALVSELATAGHAQLARQAMLNWQNDQQTRLKTRKMKTEVIKGENKPLVTQRWNLEGEPNFILAHATANFAGIEGYEDLIETISRHPKRAKFHVNKFLNSMEKGPDKTAFKSEFKEKLKEANTSYMEYWLPREGQDKDNKKVKDAVIDANKGSEDAGLKEPPTGTKYQPTQGAGFEGTEGLTQINPEDSQFSQHFQGVDTKFDIGERLNKVFWDFHSWQPEFMMSDKELEIEDKQDEVQDWTFGGFTSPAYAYFKKNPGELAAFEKDPIGYYFDVYLKNKKKKTK